MTQNSFPEIKRDFLETLQINIGYKCNQTCSHCHVNAGPNRKEMMSEETIKMIPKVIEANNIKVLDITGGAPELHPKFKQLITEARTLGVQIIDRCNLTILTEPGYKDMAKFLASNKVRIIASLPCYLKDNVDKQRGMGVFNKSIQALKTLNSFGYGIEDNDLILNLVYNPNGPKLPPSQFELEETYRKQLKDRFGIYFTNLFVLTNMPINRFAGYLTKIGKLKEYNQLLVENYKC